MIYDFPSVDVPIRQGDIFVGLPRVDVPLRKITVAGESEDVETDWNLIVQSGNPIAAILPVRPVIAIVVTQDCDASRNPDITLCEIRSFCDVYRQAKNAATVKAWVSLLTQHARQNSKWFYLPPDSQLGLAEKCAVDFTMTLRVAREDMEEMIHLRKGRLNSLADEHFREKIAEFFRRYPYDEWYPLDADELASYRATYHDAKPFPWQQA